MKKLLLFSASLLALVSLHAQVDPVNEDAPKKNTPGALEGMLTHRYLAAGMGYYFLPIASLNAQLSDMGIKTGFANAIGLGLDYGTKTTTAKLERGLTSLFSYHYLLPQDVSTSDQALKFSLNGYNAQFDLVSGSWLNSDKLTLMGGLGWAFGRLKVTEESSTGETVFLNKYFAPEFRMEFNVRLLNHLYVGIRYAYRKDWTTSGWSRSGAYAPMLGGTNMSGSMAGAFIGYGK